jgi:hypothetical protein
VDSHSSALTQTAVRRQLAEAEAGQLAMDNMVLDEDVSPAVFITMGLDYEDQQ